MRARHAERWSIAYKVSPDRRRELVDDRIRGCRTRPSPKSDRIYRYNEFTTLLDEPVAPAETDSTEATTERWPT
jgi:hypothetical protein